MLRDTAAQDRILEPASPLQRHRKVALTLTIIGALVSTVLIYWLRVAGATASVDRSHISVATVERGNFIRDITADGQVVAAVSPTLYANVSGVVALRVHAGDSVVKGQVLATVDSPELSSKLAQEEATLENLHIDWRRARLDADRKLTQLRDAYEQTQVDRKTAQREYERSRKAYQLGAYPELQVLRAQDALERAEFALDQAKKNYESQPAQNRFDVGSKKAVFDRQQVLVAELRHQVDGLSIRSPVNGQIGQVRVADRANVAKDVPLLTVVDLSALEVEIKVAESLTRDLSPGMAVELDSDGRRWNGIVSGVSPEVVSGQVVTRVRFGAERPADLRQSQRVPVRILIANRTNVLMVDRGSFVDDDGGQFAYLVHGNIAERRPIHLGQASINKVEILDGLAVGDQIVISGTDAFKGARRVILSR